MYEKVNQFHPDKVADRIAGAIVDLAYKKSENPKIAVEVLLGHGKVYVIAETSEKFGESEVSDIVKRISGISALQYVEVPQDVNLAKNQSKEIRCGDNGIFKGCKITDEQYTLTKIAHIFENKYLSDGKYLIDGNSVTICQSKMPVSENDDREKYLSDTFGIKKTIVNPLGEWDGGSDVDCGATNRKLGSDMGDGVTGGGLHGKDLSKADVSVNIVCHLLAQKYNSIVTAMCSIGDDNVVFEWQEFSENDGNIVFKLEKFSEVMSYAEVVKQARDYINNIGGFEKFAEWGLIR